MRRSFSATLVAVVALTLALSSCASPSASPTAALAPLADRPTRSAAAPPLAPASTEPTPSPEPASPSPSPLAASWSRVVLDPSGGVDEVAVANGRLVAVGSDDTHPSLVWTSPDGTHWQSADGFGESVLVGPVVAGSRGFVAFGSLGIPIPGSASAASTWTSSDGLHWRRHTLPLEPMPARAAVASTVDAIAVAMDRFVALGSVVAYCDRSSTATAMQPPCKQAEEAWSSTDGATWQLASGFAPPPDSSIWSLATDSGFVAYTEATSGTRGFWGSRDGRRWTRIAGAFVPGSLFSLGLFRGRYLAWVQRPDRVALESSADLRDWTDVTPAALRGEIPTSMFVVDDRIYSTLPADAAVGCGLASSDDGLDWGTVSLAPTICESEINAMTQFNGRIVIATGHPGGAGAILLAGIDPSDRATP